jgi:hypothetical protein
MKNRAIIFILLSCLLTACGGRDAELQRKLTGTWDGDLGQNVHSRTVVHADGSFEALLTGYPNGELIKIEGMLQAKEGRLIDTVTKCSATNVPVPYVLHGRMVRIDDHECVVRWDGATNETHSRKVER